MTSVHEGQNPFEPSRDLSQVLSEYQHVLKDNTAESLVLRPTLYDFIRSKGFENLDRDVVVTAVSEQEHLFDYKFMCDFLIATDRTSLGPCLKKLAHVNPVFTETLLNYSVEKLLEDGDTTTALFVFTETLLELEVDPSSITKFNYGDLLNSLGSIANSTGFLQALSQLADSNQVLASRLASAVLRQFFKIENKKVIKATWARKQALHLLVPRDLHWMMYFYVYIGEPQTALNIYDSLPKLQIKDQTDALLVASAGAKDWNRLQTTFEEIDIHNKTDKNYEITLQALGDLGGPEIIDQIYDTVNRSSPVIALNVYHSLLYSYGRVGNIARVKEIFQRLCQQHEPIRLSFTLALSAIKNTSELDYAQEIVAKMVGEYQIPMTNGELTQILTLCAARKDHVTAKSIFEWASKLFEPDLASWNALIGAVAYNGDAPYQTWKKMPYESDIITLTTVMAPFARYGLKERVEEIMAVKKKLGLKSDLQWLGTVLMYHCQTSEITKAEETFQQLRKITSDLPGGYYTALMNFYTNKSHLGKAQDLFKLMYESNSVAGMDFYATYLRALIRLDEQTGIELAYKVVLNMFKKDMVYDMSGRRKPRTSVPPAVIKPVVRGLIRKGSFEQASEVISLVENQDLPIFDNWALTALRIELLHAMDNPTLVSFYWVQFVEQLKKAFVPLQRNGTLVERVPPNARHSFWQIINIEIDRLVRMGRYTEVLNYPQVLDDIGLEMNSKNWNFLVEKLLTCNSEAMLIKAFDISEEKLAENWLKSNNVHDKIQPQLHRRVIRILHSSVSKVVQAISRKNSWDSSKTWKKMLKLYPKTNNVFKIANERRKTPREPV